MTTKLHKVFPTTVATGSVSGYPKLNKTLLDDIREFSKRDKMGIEWSKENYRGGYTSYASLCDLQHRAPSFLELSERLNIFAKGFAHAQEWDLRGLKLEMTACWMNIMKKGTHHTLHLHPQSVVSGVYYVATPKGSVPLKIEDPRMGFYMHAPLKKAGTGQSNSHYFRVPAKAGDFVMFESWLRHEVPPNMSDEPRVCISFNYDLVNGTDA